jgi:hypothetical protein
MLRSEEPYMKTATLLLGTIALAACASIMHGTKQDVGISSSPTGAKVTVDNQSGAATPYIATLSRKDNHIVKIEMDGYAPAELTLTKSVSGWVWGNIVFGGIIGLAVDAMTGGLYNLYPAQLQATLAKQGASLAPTGTGIYVVLVKEHKAEWIKVGQLQRVPLIATEAER